MKTAVRTMLLAAAVPLIMGAAPPVCPVKPHHATHVRMHVHKSVEHKVVGHRVTDGIGVIVDQARLISFPQPVKTLYVGDPFIADIQMIDAQHAFVLGKTFGVTNLIAMSANGTQISNQQVSVTNNNVAVTVNRGADQYNYSCTLAHCEAAGRPGDVKDFVSNSESAASSHEGMASGASSGSQTASNQ